MGIEAGSSTYYQAKRGIVQDGLIVNYDLAVKESYRGDEVLRNINGSQTASFTNGPEYVKGVGGGISFDGTNDKVPLTNPGHSRMSSSCTEVVFKKSSNPSYRAIIFGYEHVGSNYSMFVSGPIALYLGGRVMSSVIVDNPSQTSPRGYYAVYSTTYLNHDQYYHISLNKFVDTDETGYLKLYVNGSLEATKEFPAKLCYWVGAYRGRDYLDMGGPYLGGSQYANEHLNGVVSIGRLYNRILTDDEISQNFNATRHRFGV